MRLRSTAALLVVVGLFALAPSANATESRVLVTPLVFEEGGDGTGYASFQIPVGESWSLVRWRVTHYDGIDAVSVYSSANSAPTGSESVDYAVSSGGPITERKTYATPLGIGGSYLNFIVATVTNTDTPTGGFVRVRVAVN